ncbi:hypothetical protein AB205_0010910, partial [Aquarana catesbeiana]
MYVFKQSIIKKIPSTSRCREHVNLSFFSFFFLNQKRFYCTRKYKVQTFKYRLHMQLVSIQNFVLLYIKVHTIQTVVFSPLVTIQYKTKNKHNTKNKTLASVHSPSLHRYILHQIFSLPYDTPCILTHGFLKFEVV